MKSIKGIGKQIVPSLTMIGGGVGASKIGGLMSNLIKEEKYRHLAVTGLGVLIGMQKNPMMKNLGAGMVTVGGMKTIGAFFPKLGIGINGDDDLNGLFDQVLSDQVLADQVLADQVLADEVGNPDDTF